jgi:hypothetical protein
MDESLCTNDNILQWQVFVYKCFNDDPPLPFTHDKDAVIGPITRNLQDITLGYKPIKKSEKPIPTQVERYGPYTVIYDIKTDRILTIIPGTVIRSVLNPYYSRIIAVLEQNTARLRCRKTVPVITGRNGSFTAVKIPFCHGLHSENAL